MWIISQHHIRGVSSLDTTGQQQNDDERVGQRRMAVSSNVGLLETRRRLEDAAAQWLWFALPIKAERVGYGAGPLTWLRQRNPSWVGPYILANKTCMANLSARSTAAPNELMLAPLAMRPTYLS